MNYNKKEAKIIEMGINIVCQYPYLLPFKYGKFLFTPKGYMKEEKK
jgi:hypothetical protein